MSETGFIPRPEPILDISRLSVSFADLPATVDGVDIAIGPGEVVCLVGASGSGKSLTGQALMRLTPRSAKIRADRWLFEGASILRAAPAEFAKLRGGRMAIMFQDPLLALNPLMTVGDQIAEAVKARHAASGKMARQRALAILDEVKLAGGPERLDLYPHQMSGGMRQRALLAVALSGEPRLLVVDEPTSALDALVQREIVALLDNVRRERRLAMLFITHDLALVEEIADQVLVMHAGRIVERGAREDILCEPLHPYTIELLAAATGARAIWPQAEGAGGASPVSDRAGMGCSLRARCPISTGICAAETPALAGTTASHAVACWRAPAG